LSCLLSLSSLIDTTVCFLSYVLYVFLKRNEELDRGNREKDMCLENLKKSLAEEERLRVSFEKQLEEYRTKRKQLNNDKLSDQEQKIVSLNEEISRLKLELSKQIDLNAKQIVDSDLNVEDLRKNYDTLNLSFKSKLKEVEYLKQQMAVKNEALSKMEKDLVSRDLEWQQRYVYLENLKVHDSDSLSKQLLDSKNKVFIKLLFIKG
jgi:hypothetical protein